MAAPIATGIIMYIIFVVSKLNPGSSTGAEILSGITDIGVLTPIVLLNFSFEIPIPFTIASISKPLGSRA